MKKIKVSTLLIIGFLILFLLIVSVIFSLINLGNNKIYKNIFIEDVDVSKKERQEAEEEIKKLYRQKQLNGITLKHDDFEITLSYEQIGVNPELEKSVEEAYSIGRVGNIFSNNYSILFSNFIKRKININYNINEKSLDLCVNDIENKLPDIKIDGSYSIEGNELIISKGKEGVLVEKEKLKDYIIQNIKTLNSSNNTIEIPTTKEKPEEIDIEKIAELIRKEPKDAYLSSNPLEVHAEENGVELAISIEEAKQVLSEEKEEYTLPLKITEANTKVADLGENAFPNLLSSYTTNYDASNINRDNNLVLSANKINGVVINSGEEFSYNQTIGKRTIENGFKEAKAYAGGKVVLDVGGGICQLSSTLYNSVLLANLEITERHNHYFKTSYVPEGRDATVSWGALDFKFKNNRKYPIKIEANVGDGVATINIYGIKQDDDCTVIIDSGVTSIIASKTEYQIDSSLKKGEEVITQNGSNGCTSETYKTLLRNGTVVSKTLISSDTYNALPTIIKRNK